MGFHRNLYSPLQHEIDFTLARFWRYGNDCIVRTPAGARESSAFTAATNLIATDLGFNATMEQDVLGRQCPPRFLRGELLSCAWYSHVCGKQWHARLLAMGQAAGELQRDAQLPPRTLLYSESCLSSACIAHRGTARRRTNHAPVELSRALALRPYAHSRLRSI